jgi:predicted nucleic acid-binding protein
VSGPKPSYLLDTSALVTLLEDEAGADRVEHVLKQASTLICAVSLLELRYITLQVRTEAEADVRHALLKRSGATILWELDEPIVLKAAGLKAEHSISLADAVIAASAHRHGAILLHKDPEFDGLPDSIKQERLPYKAAGKAR